MSAVAVRIEGLGKQYRLGQLQGPRLLREGLTEWARQAITFPATRTRNSGRTADEMFWALRDVTLDVAAGESLGIIGPNGGGKSTLLKILSRITDPTEGHASINGRVGSLLEVGTGFHPELTGRENVYLNGAILGMKRREIDRKFDEIVEFSGIERFLDTPVKRYSSGMFLRLAFAVAAHLEPEILIVDEVLAVGDASFQRKCIAKMAEVARAGRTVLFVSHNLAAVQSLCNRAVLLQDGRVHDEGPVRSVVTNYQRSVEEAASKALRERSDRRGHGAIRLADVLIATDADAAPGILVTGWPAQFAFHVDAMVPAASVWFTIYDSHGQAICSFHSRTPGPDYGRNGATGPVVCQIDELPLVPGFYRINAGVYDGEDLEDHVEGAALFEVVEGTLRDGPVSEQSGHGSVRLPHRWILPGADA